MKSSLSRRNFLSTSAKAGGLALLPAWTFTTLSACSSARVLGAGMSDFGFAQSPLPYAYHALEPVVDARTMEIHYSKHAAAYAANLQDAAKAEGVAPGQSLQQLLGQVQKYSAKLRNNGGGHYNHELFWRCMKPGGGTTPAGSLREAIHQSFGSLEAMQQQFNDAAKGQFGSGWAWLYADAGKQLRIGATPNQDNPLMPVSAVRGTPLLGLDVWEHAYYLQYQNRRADYVNAWWKVVNWAYVEERFGLL